MSLFRQPSIDKRYRTYGPWITTATITEASWAFTAVDAEAEGDDWIPGVIAQDADDLTRYTFRILVSGTGGGGTVELADGDYRMWVKVDQTPEAIALPIGTLTVY
jgi:hypothetical protein